MAIRIGILGTRGIPNYYGGFERLAEQLSVGLINMGHQVWVYNSHNHKYQGQQWKDVNIIHCFDPEYVMGSAGQFVYDFNCIMDARKRNFNVLLVLGYTSSSIWNRLLPSGAVVIYNMDGMEWMRTKYSDLTRKFLRYAEKLAVDPDKYYITDSVPIQAYFKRKYQRNSEYIAYGADIQTNENTDILKKYGLSVRSYMMLVARIEPENNVEMILDGFRASQSPLKFVVVGNTANGFGKYLIEKFKDDPRIKFVGAIYDALEIHSLRIYSELYFHGHSAGGTNPSLLEAMASRSVIAAHDNVFNKAVLECDALYFKSSAEITALVHGFERSLKEESMIANNLIKIRNDYNWIGIFEKYEGFMLRCLYARNHERNLLHKGYAG